MTRFPAVAAAVRSLIHPASLVTVVVLILNDHLFKTLWPSWLTGKLSDFAGLFFFPAFLALLLGFFATPFRRFTPKMVGATAFGLTAFWFAAAKATTIGHAVTTDLVSWLLGARAVIALDPTDLVALIVLVPAWRLWRRSTIEAHRPIPVRLAIPAILLASLGTMATSPTEENLGVYDLFVVGDTLQANVWEEGRFASTDNGRTWRQVETVRLPETDMRGPGQDTVVVADPRHPGRLYRALNGPVRIERSDDDGGSWSVAWRISEERMDYIDRHLDRVGGDDLAIYANDLIFTPDGSTLVAAVGLGVVVRDSAGEWSAYDVGAIASVEPAASGIGDVVRALELEWFMLLAMALLAGTLVTAVGRTRALSAERRAALGKERGSRRLGCAIAMIALFLIGILSLALDYGPIAILFVIPLFFPLISFGVVLVLAAVALARAWVGIYRDAEPADAKRASKIVRLCIAATAVAFIVPALPLILWTVGAVEQYQPAGVAALVLWGAVCVGGVVFVKRVEGEG